MGDWIKCPNCGEDHPVAEPHTCPLPKEVVGAEGRFAFDPEKFVALAEHIWQRQRVSAEKLELLIWNIDVDAYRKLGAPITGASYVKGPRHPEVANVDRNWFRAFVRARTPLWARLAAWPLVLYVLVRSRRP